MTTTADKLSKVFAPAVSRKITAEQVNRFLLDFASRDSDLQEFADKLNTFFGR